MNRALLPWRRLLPVWLPTVLLCLMAGAALIWQTSESGGRASLIRKDIADLEGELARLEQVLTRAETERAAVAELNGRFENLYDEVFGDLEERLIAILTEVGLATREAGLLPGGYSYLAEQDRKLGYTRFSIQFSVTGDYSQIRQMLAALQSSREFLIVDSIAFAGEEEGAGRNLQIGVRVATYLAEANPKTLDRLTGGIKLDGETDAEAEG
jgi:Tfp pilus assembly protein PilO